MAMALLLPRRTAKAKGRKERRKEGRRGEGTVPNTHNNVPPRLDRTMFACVWCVHSFPAFFFSAFTPSDKIKEARILFPLLCAFAFPVLS